MADLGIAIPFGALLLALLGYVISLSRTVGALEAHYETLKCLPDMKRQLDQLSFRQELQDGHAADILHSPDHRERDELVRGLLGGTLAAPEIDRVALLLREAKTNGCTAEERLSAALLLGRVEWELKKGKSSDD